MCRDGTDVATWKYKLRLLGFFIVAYHMFYVFPNFSPVVEPRQLPLLGFDTVAPFLPWTFLVYISDYLLIALVIIAIKDLDEFNAFARRAFTILVISGIIFIVVPTTYPRPIYPEQNNALVAFVMNLVAKADTPNNCFPSLHVAMTASAVWCLRRSGPKWFPLFAMWGLLIAASTLTTKQHYFVDILGGCAVTAVVVYVERLFVKRAEYSKAVVEKAAL